MKKFVSLLLTFALILGTMSITIFASVDVSVNPATAENDLTELTNSGNTGFSANNVEKVTVEADSADAANKIFKIIGDGTSQSGSYALVNRLTSGTNAFFSSEVNRFSAKIKLSDVTDIDAATEVFVPSRGWPTAASNYTFGVKLKTGGAYYWDEENSVYEAFVAGGTMSADKWYRIEAIMDNRETALDGNKTYMNAFIYDVENNNSLVGTSGWQYVSNDAPYSGNCSFLSVQIQSYLYSPDYPIYVDEFNVFKVTELPSYSVKIGGDGVTNKYINVGSTTSFRAIGEYFNTSEANAHISETSVTKAARFEIDLRYFSDTQLKYFPYNIFELLDAKKGTASGTPPVTGTVYIGQNGIEVRSYSGSKYDTAVTLSNDNTAYASSVNTWYRFVWDVDYTDYANPVGMLYVKDQNGNILVQTKEAYAIQPMPFDQYGRTLIMYCASTQTTGTNDRRLQLDNTNIYVANSVEDLSDVTKRITVVEEDFDVFDNDLYAVGATDDEGNAIVYNDIARTHQGSAIVDDYECSDAKIVEEAIAFVDGTELGSTNPVAFTFTYDNPVPVANLTKDNIKLLAGNTDIEMTYGEHYEIAYEDEDTDGSVTAFKVNILQLDYSTSYKLRLMAELADGNEALSGGVPADSGLYRDFTFSTGEYVPGLTFTGAIVDENGDAVSALSANQTIKGKVALTNVIDDSAYCYVILALYDGNQLEDYAVSDKITVEPGSEPLEFVTEETLTTTKADLTAKLFVWNSLEFMYPFGEPVVVPAAS